MDVEDELIMLELVGVNFQAGAVYVAATPLLATMAVALVGSAFFMLKMARRHRRSAAA